MALISEKDAVELRKELAEFLDSPVKLLVFTQEAECELCAPTRQIAEEVAALSDKISVQVLDLIGDKEAADRYGIDKTPAIAILRSQDGQERDYRIRFYGIPSGYEFTSLIEDIVMVSKGETMLKPKTRATLSKVSKPVHIQVFVTPTCPYCNQAVTMAHQFAMENELIRADMVEATEFPDLVSKYQVHGVPRIVFNESLHQEGLVPEAVMLARLLEAIGEKPAEKPGRATEQKAARKPAEATGHKPAAARAKAHVAKLPQGEAGKD